MACLSAGCVDVLQIGLPFTDTDDNRNLVIIGVLCHIGEIAF